MSQQPCSSPSPESSATTGSGFIGDLPDRSLHKRSLVDNKALKSSSSRKSSVISIASTSTSAGEEDTRPCKCTLTIIITIASAFLVAIALAISLSSLFDAYAVSSDKALHLLAQETIVVSKNYLEDHFRRLSLSVEALSNATGILKLPFEPGISAEQKQVRTKLWMSHLMSVALDLPPAVTIHLTFKNYSANTLILNMLVRKAEICQSIYPHYRDIPRDDPIDYFTNCTIDAVDPVTYVHDGVDLKYRTNYSLRFNRLNYEAEIWNQSVQVARTDLPRDQRPVGVWLPQRYFFDGDKVAGHHLFGWRTETMFLLQCSRVYFDPVTDIPESNAVAVIDIVGFSTSMRSMLPKNGSTGAASYLLDNHLNVISSSYPESPYTLTSYSGEPVYRGCYVAGGSPTLGCFHNISTYPNYELLRVARQVEGNWTETLPGVFETHVHRESDGETFVAFRSTPENNFIGLPLELYVVIPLSYFTPGVDAARQNSIVLIVIVVLCARVVDYLLLRFSLRSVEDLAERMKDPLHAELHVKQESKSKSGSSNSSSNTSSSNKSGGVNTAGEKSSTLVVVGAEEKEKQESSSAPGGDGGDVDETEETKSLWQQILQWQPEEILEIETEFAAFRAVIDQLRGFVHMKGDPKKIRHNLASLKHHRSRETETSATTAKKSIDHYYDEEQPSISMNEYARSPSKDAVVDPAANSSSSGNTGEDSNQQQPKKKKKKAVKFAVIDEEGSEKPGIMAEGEMNSALEKHFAKSQAAAAGSPGTKASSRPPPLSAKRGSYSLSKQQQQQQRQVKMKQILKQKMCFVAAVHVPAMGDRCDQFFNLNITSPHVIKLTQQEQVQSPILSPSSPFTIGDNNKKSSSKKIDLRQSLIDFSTLAVEKIVHLATTCGATLIDFHGDHFLICVQLRIRVGRTKIPSRVADGLDHASVALTSWLKKYRGRILQLDSSSVSPTTTPSQSKNSNVITATASPTSAQHHGRSGRNNTACIIPSHFFDETTPIVSLSAGFSLGQTSLVSSSGSSKLARPVTFVGDCVAESMIVEREMRFSTTRSLFETPPEDASVLTPEELCGGIRTEARTRWRRRQVETIATHSHVIPCHSSGFLLDQKFVFESIRGWPWWSMCKLRQSKARDLRWLESTATRSESSRALAVAAMAAAQAAVESSRATRVSSSTEKQVADEIEVFVEICRLLSVDK